jgi:aryl-alcohol dehydrogenase-like predicted oxidoreductase|tara:strand:- start:1076 stop:2116 length:1041 start_codon:yes stop_codon:yes gene_type:complete
MKYRKLGNTNIDVSLICLGTMTWGEQNSEQEAFEQMDLSLDRGVNFFDTAELYSIPPKKETFGSTEKIIGNWFKKRKSREKIILATKVVGRSGMKWFRGKETRLNKEQILEAVEGSLKRLQTDYIDLYQIHWPDRKSNFFGKLGYEHQEESDTISIKDQLEVLSILVKSGKIRHIGLSNETPWGLMKFISLAEQYDLPRVVSIQNPYSLLNRSFEVGLAEISIREKCGLLAYSPLGFGILTGKYDDGQNPDDARLTLFGDMFTRYTKPKGRKVASKLNKLAIDNELTPTEMALSYVNSRPFITSNIIGATKIDQLKENIGSVEIELSEEVIKEIEDIHAQDPYPCP